MKLALFYKELLSSARKQTKIFLAYSVATGAPIVMIKQIKKLIN